MSDKLPDESKLTPLPLGPEAGACARNGTGSEGQMYVLMSLSLAAYPAYSRLLFTSGFVSELPESKMACCSM